MSRKVLLTISAFFTVFVTFGYQLRGFVQDESGNPMPYVNVFKKNTTYGVVTNLKGEYFLELKPGKHTITFSFIGYKSKDIEVNMQKNSFLNVTLISDNTELQELEVKVDKKRDYSYTVIENAIKARKKYRNQYENFKCNVYIKAALEKKRGLLDSLIFNEDSTDIKNDEGDILKMDFVESYSDFYFESENKMKEIKTGYRDFSRKYATGQQAITINVETDNYGAESMVNRNLFKLNLSDATFNFYKNLQDIQKLGPVPYTSPISSAAFLSYKFRFVEDFEQDGLLINKIEVIPRNDAGALFKGYIYIVDGLWNIKAVDLEINKLGLRFFKYFRIMQNYEMEQDSIWVLQQEDYYYHTRFLGDTIMGNTLIRYNNYEFNKEFPKNLFGNELQVIEDEAIERDSAYWEQNRPITLKQEEIDFIHKEDSIQKYQESKEYLKRQDSIANHLNVWSFLAVGVYHQNSFRNFSFRFAPLTEQINPFGVGGYRHRLRGSIKKEWTRANALELDYQVDYGFNNKDIKGYVMPKFTYAPKKFGKVKIGAGKTFDVINNYESLEATFSRGNYIQSLSYSIGNEIELVNGVYMDGLLEYTEKRSIAGYTLSEWSNNLFGNNNIPADFDGYDQLILDLNFKIRYKQKYRTEPYKKVVIGSNYPKLDIQYKKGFNGLLGSEVDYDFLEFKLHDDVKVGTMGQTKYKLFAGKFINGNEVKFTDYKFFRGSDRWIFSNPLRSFQLMDTVRISTKNAYLQANYLHRFNGTLLNKVPLLKRLGLHSVGGVGFLATEDSNFRHFEVFAGIEKPFKLWDQMFKFGVYYVASDSNFSKTDTKFKFGIDIFNSWNNSWSY